MVNEIKSQDELNQPETHSTDVLLSTIEELDKMTELYARAKWWLNEIVSNHRFTPVSTAEMALKDLKAKEIDNGIR